MSLRNSKKIAETVREEIQKEVDRIVTRLHKDKETKGRTDLESFEMHIRDSMHSVGAIMLEQLLNEDGGDYRGRTIPGDNGGLFEFVDY